MGSWFWCLRHARVESESGCRAEDRLGPYDTKEAASAWRERHGGREERWEDEDRRWEEWEEDGGEEGA